MADVLAAVLTSDPDWSALPADTPPRVRDLLRRCLAKDRKQRLRDIGDARLQMEMRETEPAPLSAPGRSRHSLRWLLVGATVALLAVPGILAWSGWRARNPASRETGLVSRFSIPLEGGQRVNVGVDLVSVAVSEDGRRVAWIGGKAPDTKIFTRALDSLEIRPIRGTEGVYPPFLSLSPDGAWVCFARWAVLYKVPVGGGDPVEIFRSEDSMALPLFTQWTEDGILFAYGDSSIRWISDDGKATKTLTTIDPARQEVGHFRPRALPGKRGILFNVQVGNYDVGHIEAFDSETRERKRVLDNAHLATYVPTGHLIFARSGSLFAVPFDLRQMKTAGVEVPLQLDVQMDSAQMRHGYWDVSPNGTFVYVPDDPAISQTRLVWVDRANRRAPLDLPAGTYWAPAYARNSQSLAYAFRAVGRVGKDIWTLDTDRGVPRQLTRSGDNTCPAWSPDGTRLAFKSNQGGQWNIWVQPWGSDAAPKPWRTSKSIETPHSYSPDGKSLLFTERRVNMRLDLYLADLEHPEDKPVAVAASPALESWGRVHPTDGRWVVYTAQEERVFEVFIKEVIPGSPASGQRKKVSPAGGAEPVWSPGGDEIFYRSEDGTKLYSVSFSSQPTLTLGPEKLVLDNLSMRQFDIMSDPSYDISADGKRFVMVFTDSQAGGAGSVVVIQNWFEELRAKFRK